MDPKLLASGSDDAKGDLGLLHHSRFSVLDFCSRCSRLSICVPVKLWSTNLDNSVASIEAKANVCCVKFSPTSRYHLAFGCAGEITEQHQEAD